MSIQYLKDGISVLTAIKRQRDSVVDNLNNCQGQFIGFLERPCEKQDKINDFVASFNKFSSEFPDLRKDDQTKEELLNRVEQLSNTLWDIIVKRKDESLAKISSMQNGGWSDQEMKASVKNIASLIEIEIKKFEAVYKVVMQNDPPIELDAEIMTKKLLDRAVAPFDGQAQSSPVLEKVIGNLFAKLEELTTSNIVVQQVANDQQGQILQREKQVFIYRLALIYSWAIVQLEEIYLYSQ